MTWPDSYVGKILHGDCLEIMLGMPDGAIDAVITDPPYSSGGQYRGDRAQSTITKYVQTDSIETCRNPFSGDNRDQRSFLLWCSLWMGQARRITKSGGIIVCFTDWRQLPTIADAIQCGGWTWRGIGTWWKPGVRMQRGRFSASAEYVVYGSNGTVTPGKGSPQNVFQFAPVSGIDKEHIAEKPIDVLRWILPLVPENSIVLDPFIGGGTTAIACSLEGHRYIGIEIDRQSCDIAEERLRNTTPPLPFKTEKQEQGCLL